MWVSNCVCLRLVKGLVSVNVALLCVGEDGPLSICPAKREYLFLFTTKASDRLQSTYIHMYLEIRLVLILDFLKDFSSSNKGYLLLFTIISKYIFIMRSWFMIHPREKNLYVRFLYTPEHTTFTIFVNFNKYIASKLRRYFKCFWD